MLDDLKEEVCAANRRLAASGLAALTWGNASGCDPRAGLVAIKPSGVEYEKLASQDMVVVDMGGNVVEGKLRPSSDTLTHLEIYRNFQGVRGVVHAHLLEVTAWAQALREIPAYGTTHADVFHGSVPLTRTLTEEEVAEAYELNTGKAIVERFRALEPCAVPGVLVAGHAPFTWGKTPGEAGEHAIALEAIAKMARLTEQIACATSSPRPRCLRRRKALYAQAWRMRQLRAEAGRRGFRAAGQSICARNGTPHAGGIARGKAPRRLICGVPVNCIPCGRGFPGN